MKSHDHVAFVFLPGCPAQAGHVVGVDMEWRAGFGTVSRQRISLIQLAVKERVFLLDLCAPGLSHHSLTVNFIRTLLTNTSVIKLGEDL